MIIPRELVKIIEESAPPGFAAPWDNSGMQVAGTRTEVRRLAVFLDPLPELVETAMEWGADFLLCHHPLLLEPRLPNRVDFYHRVLGTMLRGGSWLYAAHTSLDANPKGPVLWLARELGLDGVRVMEPGTGADGGEPCAQPQSGFGIIGTLPRPMAWADFAARLRPAVRRGTWTAAGPLPERVSTVAYCPGSGGSLVGLAKGADVFITGDLRYHQAQQSIELGLFTIDVGHFVLEERMMEFWAEGLREVLGDRAEVRFLPGTEPLRSMAIA